MCFNRLPLTSLKNARLVCKRWSSFIIECRLLRTYQNLWLYVFGTLPYSDTDSRSVRDDVNQIHALDLSRNKWHDINANFLNGRFMFSIAGIRNGIFIVGGKSCHKLHSMKYARCVPILGVTEDPIIPFIRRRRRSDHSNSSSKGIKRSFLLIVVGGFDDWSSNHGGTDEDSLMYSGEMYDSLTNKWTDIQTYDIEKGFWFSIQTPSFGPNKPPYEPKLVSTNGRIFLVSNRWPNIRRQIHNLVSTLWELDLMNLTWTEIPIDPEVITDWRHVEFAANRNIIFGAKMSYPSINEILEYFIACNVSESIRAKWNDISSKVVNRREGLELYRNPKVLDPFWTRSMTVIHVSI
ncbi:hypothetical protein P8452_16830 [Trifolium repens]|nr:hypothetical protein P8452_16830 [Trifolium repens]